MGSKAAILITMFVALLPFMALGLLYVVAVDGIVHHFRGV